MKDYGYRIISEDGRFTVARRPWPGQLPLLCLIVLIGLLAAVGNAVTQEGPRMVVGMLIVVLAIAWFIRQYMAAAMERLTVEDSGIITWVKLGVFRPRTESIPLAGIMPDAKENRLLVRGTVILSRRGTNSTLQGDKARVTILASNGPGRKYNVLLVLATIEKELEGLAKVLLEFLPECRYERMSSL